MISESTINENGTSQHRPAGIRVLLDIWPLIIVAIFLMASCKGKHNEELAGHDSTTVELVRSDSVANFYAENADKSTFKSNRDTNQYKSDLLHLKELVVSGADVPAKVLFEATPRSESEYDIWYRLAECEWVTSNNSSIVSLDNLLMHYAIADSAGAMSAYMFFGELVDGYVAESVFDGYIALEKKQPAKFSALRKNRSKRWNEGYDEWKKLMSE